MRITEEKKSKPKLENKTKSDWKKSTKKVILNFKQQKEFKKLEKEIKKIETKKDEIQNLFTNVSLEQKEIEQYSIKLGVLNK